MLLAVSTRHDKTRSSRSSVGYYRAGGRVSAHHALCGGLRARPLEARPDRTAGIIWFVIDLRSNKEHEIESEREVGLVFVDANSNAYLSITARAVVRLDPAKTSEIWKATDDMWWQGPDDPNACLLSVRPLTAELWDGPSSNVVAAFEFVKAQLTGEKPNLGENRQATVSMIRAEKQAEHVKRWVIDEIRLRGLLLHGSRPKNTRPTAKD
jgi:general stress protein 26